MDPYIRDFNAPEINTIVAHNVRQAGGLFALEEDKYFTLFHTNIRSVAKNFEHLEVLLSQFKNNFDIVVLTETWQLPRTDLFNLSGYNKIYSEGQINQNDGVIVYIKKEHNYEVFIHEIFGIKCIRFIIQSNKETLGLTAIYKSPTIDIIPFTQELSNYLNQNKCNIEILVGDINIDILKCTDESNEYLNTLHEYGFISLINKPTRNVNGTSSCLDHIFLRAKNIDTDSMRPVVLHSPITDHFPTLLAFPLIKNIHSKVGTIEYNKLNYCKLKQMASVESFNTVYLSQDVNLATDSFIKTLKYIIDISTTKIKYRAKNKKKEWMTAGLIKSIENRDKLYEAWLRTKDEDTLRQFKIHRNKITNLISKLKNNHYKAEIQNNKNNTKKIWETVNKFVNKSKKVNIEINEIQLPNGTKTQETLDICNIFNNHYSSIGHKLATQISSNILGKMHVKENIKVPENSLFLKNVNQTEVLNTIRELKPEAAPGLDGITSRVLKEIANEICSPIAYLVNLVIETGSWPQQFREASITPIYKSGDKACVENYRPISLLSNVGKIFEKIIKVRLVDFLTKNKLLSEKQFGFTENKNTADAIAFLTQKIYTALDRGRPCAGVFIDLAKAFDTVSHKLLLKKLENIGVRGLGLQLFESYLSNRRQSVKIKNVIGKPEPVTYGIPQGTVLGPILFIIYLNGLLTLNCCGTIISFADDTALFVEGDSWSSVESKLVSDLQQITQWFDKYLLTINLNKTIYLPFSNNITTTPEKNNIEIYLPQRGITWKIEKQQNAKYLGILIDIHLRWDKHVQALVRKVRSLMYIFKQTKKILSLRENLSLYYSLVQSLLTYGIIGWGGAYNNNLNPLIVIQKRILKIIFNLDIRFPTEDLYRYCNALSIRQLFYKSAILTISKNNLLLEKINHKHSTREKAKQSVRLPLVLRTIGQRSYFYIGHKLYNIIPGELKSKISKKSFKFEIKIWIGENNPLLLD